MTTTPDGISFAALQDMLADAPKEGQAAPADDAPMSRERIEEIADKCLTYAAELGATGPMVHKTMMVMTLSNLIQWHNTIAQQHVEAGEIDTAGAWARDAGKCQAMLDILYSINCGGEDDFLCRHE